MFRLITLFALVTCSLAYPSKQARVPLLDGRIVGGQTVTIEEYPYQVSLTWFGSHICGGSLVSSNVVVTAAHCTDGSGVSSLGIRAGSSYRTSGGVTTGLSALYQHPSYDGWNIDYDISVLVVANSFSLSDSINVIGLPVQSQDIPAGVDSTVTGWGTLNEGGSLPNQLQRVVVPTVSLADCRAAYGQSAVTDRMMCAGVLGVGGLDACQGDSGGPLVIEGELIGIVSWGYGCARPDYPGVYSSVPALRSFITQSVGI